MALFKPLPDISKEIHVIATSRSVDEAAIEPCPSQAASRYSPRREPSKTSRKFTANRANRFWVGFRLAVGDSTLQLSCIYVDSSANFSSLLMLFLDTFLNPQHHHRWPFSSPLLHISDEKSAF